MLVYTLLLATMQKIDLVIAYCNIPANNRINFIKMFTLYPGLRYGKFIKFYPYLALKLKSLIFLINFYQ